MPHTFPIMLDIAARSVVIIGGGKVAARKADGLLAAGATRVRAVAPEFGENFPEGVQRIVERYQPEHLDGAQLVFAATDDAEVNAAVARDARDRGALVCRADDGEDGDFSIPGVVRRDALTIAVAAGSPWLTMAVLDEIVASLKPQWAKLANAMAVLRPWIQGKVPDVQLRRAILRDTLEMHVKDEEELRQMLMAKYPELR